MILTVLLPYRRATPCVAGQAAVVAMLTAEAARVRLLAVRYDTPESEVERARLDATDVYLRACGWSVRAEPGAEYLSDVWNLGQALARVWADMEQPEAIDLEPWSLIVVDPTVQLAPGALADIAEALESNALVYDTPARESVPGDALPPIFDGRLFGFAHADAGILLTRHDHTDPESCAADLLACLDAEADVLALATGSGRLT